MISKKYAPWLKILFIFFSILTLSIAFMNDGLIKPVQNKKIDIYTDVGEGKVFGRLALSKKEGIFSQSGLLGFCKDGTYTLNIEDENQRNSPKIQRKILESGDCEGYTTYKSHPGLQWHIFHWMSLIGLGDYFYYRLFAAIILGCVLGAFILWILFEFNFLTGIIVFILLLFQNWIIILWDNISMLFGITFIPLVISFWFFYKKKVDTFWYKISLLFSLMLVLLLNGAEFVFASMTMPFIPLLYYSIKNRYTLKYITRKIWVISWIIFSALICVWGILFLQLTLLEWSPSKAFFHFTHKIWTRTQLEESTSAYALKDTYNWDSVDATPNIDMLRWYIDKIAIHIWDLALSFGYIFMLLGIISLFLTIRYFYTRDRRIVSLLIVYWCSFVMPIVWICVFKWHAIFHIFLDPIVWYMPTLLLGMILVWFFFHAE